MSSVATIPDPATVAVPSEALLSAEAFAEQYESEPCVELVQGRVVRYPMPGGEHGKICFRLIGIFSLYLMEHDLGHALSHDTFLRIRRDPDTLRCPDFQFVSYAKLAKGVELEMIPQAVADLVVEVKSPSDSWTLMITKASDYLLAGVGVVVILDPKEKALSVFRSSSEPCVLSGDSVLTLPEVLPGFSVAVSQFFG